MRVTSCICIECTIVTDLGPNLFINSRQRYEVLHCAEMYFTRADQNIYGPV